MFTITLTDRQKEAYDAIISLVKSNQTWPSFRELQHHLGYASPNSVTQIIHALVAKGWLIKRGSAYDFADFTMPHLTPDRKARIERQFRDKIKAQENKDILLSYLREVLDDQ